MSTLAPQPLINTILNQFANPNKGAYGQIATCDPSGMPHTRTVHIQIYENWVAINTHTQSSKWLHLMQNPQLSGCHWDIDQQLQIRFSGNCQLVCIKKVDQQHIRQHLWQRMRRHVRQAYVLDAANRPIVCQPEPAVDVSTPSDTHGVILCQPTVWDIFHNDPQHYCNGRRECYRYDAKQGLWLQTRQNLLHQQSIQSY